MRLEELRSRRVGVVFSSSFFGFFAHAGCLSALGRLGVKPCGFSGTSAGALIAAFASCNVPISRLYEILMGVRKKDFWDVDYRGLAKGAVTLFRGWTGLLKGRAFRNLLRQYLPVTNIEECTVPCCIVATNISRKCKTVFTKGDIVNAVHASGSFPGLFKPALINGDYYIDGGAVSKAPLIDLYNAAKPEVIIVHYIRSEEFDFESHYFLSKVFTPFKILSLADAIIRHSGYRQEVEYVMAQGCEVIEIEPRITRVTPNKLNLGPQAFKEAEIFTEKILSER